MARGPLLEELHLTVRAPQGLREGDYGAMVRTLESVRFRVELRRAIRDVFRRYPVLKRVRFALQR